VQIVGSGFLARNLDDPRLDRYDGVVAVAAGVSSTSVTAAADFDREADLVYELLRRCRADGRTLLFFSTASFAMYGNGDAPATEDGPLFPPTAYGRHKLALESCVRRSGADFLILRLSHLVGPHQRGHQLLPAMIEQVRSGTVTLYRDAHRDLLDTADLVDVIDALLGRGIRDEVINVVSGVPQPIKRIVAGIEQRMGTRAERTVIDGHAAQTTVSLRRLRRFVPGALADATGPGYLDRLLDRYLPGYTDTGSGDRDAIASSAVGAS
jgi:nucleoside-diphosphate-sugar epimerase